MLEPRALFLGGYKCVAIANGQPFYALAKYGKDIGFLARTVKRELEQITDASDRFLSRPSGNTYANRRLFGIST